MLRTLWRHLKLHRHFNQLGFISGVLRIGDDGIIVLRWNFKLFKALEDFCRSLPASRQEALRSDAEAVLMQQQKDCRADLEHCSPSLKRTLLKGIPLVDSVREATVPLECAVTTHLTEDELLSLSKDQSLKRISWNQIQEVVAYKVDLFTVDDVRLGFISQDGSGVEASESMLGWRALRTEVSKRFPEIDPAWEGKIIQPPFAENWTHLWPIQSGSSR